MKRFFFIPALCLFLASCGGDEGTKGGGVPSLKVEPSSLDFDASSAPSQSVTVTAENVEWEVRVSETASSWLKAEKTDGTTVTVSVTDNDTPEQRTGSFTVAPTNGEDVKAKSVTVTQSGGDVEYKLTVEPASLTFEAEGAAAQTVTVTAEGGLTWEAAADGDAASWITVTPGEGTLEVKVADNPEATERSGNVVITPSVSSVGPKAIRVTQAGKVFPPSLSINVEDPETGVRFRANGAGYNGTDDTSIRVTAVNTDWDAKAIDADGNAVTWFAVTANKDDGMSMITLTVTPNETFEERVGYVLVTATAEEVADIRVAVTQDAALEHLSTLTDDVDVSGMAHAWVGVYPNQDWHAPEKPSNWAVTLTTENLTVAGPESTQYVGSGIYLNMYMGSEHMPFNDDKEYWMADGTYDVAPHEEGSSMPKNRMEVSVGYQGYWPGQQFGSWVSLVEDGEQVESGPFAAGTVEVSRSGDDYTFTLDVTDDFGRKITGTFTVVFDDIRQQNLPTPEY